MRLFISHATADLHLAEVLQLRLEEVSAELKCFLLADDVFAGEVWEERIRRAAEECDGILSLVTSRYIERPWFIAEWALFWFQDKPWYLLIEDIELPKIFEPMRRRQVSRLDDRRSVERLLRALTDGDSSSRPLDLLAAELVKAAADVRRGAARANREATLARFALSLKRGTVDVSELDVDHIIQADALDKAVELAEASDNSVALRQFACVLLSRDKVEAAHAVAKAIPNNAERRSVGVAALDVLADDLTRADVRLLLEEVYGLVREPQRRDLRQAADRRGVSIAWPEVPANP